MSLTIMKMLFHKKSSLTVALPLTALLLAPSAGVHAESNFPLDAPLSADVCMTCHGGYGQGSEVVGGPKLAGMEPWYLKRQLLGFRSGFRGIEKEYIPAFEMRALAATLSDAEIDRVVADISEWQDVPATPTLEGDAEAGATLYTSCAACHGAQAEGNEALGAPALANRNDWYLLHELERFSVGQRGVHADDVGGQQMRAMMTSLPDENSWRDVLVYINSLSKLD
ncbi:MAG: c-type cytochrome [Pseudomonadota bacterium]